MGEKDVAVSDTGKHIQELRIKAGYTQRTLADALHVTDKAISKWKGHLPSRYHFSSEIVIALGCRCRIDYFENNSL